MIRPRSLAPWLAGAAVPGTGSVANSDSSGGDNSDDDDQSQQYRLGSGSYSAPASTSPIATTVPSTSVRGNDVLRDPWGKAFSDDEDALPPSPVTAMTSLSLRTVANAATSVSPALTPSVDTAPMTEYHAYDPALFTLLQTDAKMFATQMAVVNFSFFVKIQRAELASLAWTRGDKMEKAPNVATFTQRFNNMTLWASHEILQSANIKRRAEKISHFIHIAKCCFRLNNFHGLKSILAGLQSTPVHRLSKTWALLGRKDRHTFEKLADFMQADGNSEKYRKRVQSVKLPCIPFLGQHLSDLMFIDQAARVSTSASGKAEREHQANALLDWIEHLQSVPYDYAPIPGIVEFLSSDQFIAELQPFYEEENYRISLQLEPKEGAWSHGGSTPLSGTAPSQPVSVGASISSFRWPLVKSPLIGTTPIDHDAPKVRSDSTASDPKTAPASPGDRRRRPSPTLALDHTIIRTNSLPLSNAPNNVSNEDSSVSMDDAIYIGTPAVSTILQPVIVTPGGSTIMPQEQFVVVTDAPSQQLSSQRSPVDISPTDASLSQRPPNAALAETPSNANGAKPDTATISTSSAGWEDTVAITATQTTTANSNSNSGSGKISTANLGTPVSATVPPVANHQYISPAQGLSAKELLNFKRSSWAFSRKELKDGDQSIAIVPLRSSPVPASGSTSNRTSTNLGSHNAPSATTYEATSSAARRHRRVISLIDDSIIDQGDRAKRKTATPLSPWADSAPPPIATADNDSDFEEHLSDDDNDDAEGLDGVVLRSNDNTRIQGKLVRKDITEHFKRARKRSWRPTWAILQPPYILFFRDKPKPGRKKPKSYLLVNEYSFVHVATDYKKRKYVLRLLPSEGYEYLFDAPDEVWLADWVQELERAIHEAKQRRDNMMISRESF